MCSYPACWPGLPSLTINRPATILKKHYLKRIHINYGPASHDEDKHFHIIIFQYSVLYWWFPAGTRSCSIVGWTSIWALGVGSVTSANWEHLYHQRHKSLYWFWACRMDMKIIYLSFFLLLDLIVVFIPLKTRITLFLRLLYHAAQRWMVLRYACSI